MYFFVFEGRVKDCLASVRNTLPPVLKARSFAAIASSPGWHRRLRKRRQGARKVLRSLATTRSLRPRQVQRLQHILPCLRRHHTWSTTRQSWPWVTKFICRAPSTMSWKTQHWYPNQWQQKKSYWPNKPKGKESAHKQGAMITAYDGRKVPLEPDFGLAFNASQSSSASASSGATQLDKYKNCLQSLVSKMGSTEDLPSDIQQLLQEDPRQKLQEEQRAMNAKRKLINRIEKLKSQISDKENKFTTWKKGIKDILKKEETRHQDHMKQLKKDLENAIAEQNGVIALEDEQDSDMEDEDVPPFNHPYMEKFLSDMQERMEQAAARSQHIEAQHTTILQQMHLQMQQMQQRLPSQTEVPAPVAAPIVAPVAPEVVAAESPQHPATPRRVGDALDPAMQPFRNTRGRDRTSPYGPTRELNGGSAAREAENSLDGLG